MMMILFLLAATAVAYVGLTGRGLAYLPGAVGYPVLIAAVGALPYARQKLVDWHSVLYFGVPGILGTYGGAALSRVVPGAVQLALFAVVMIIAAVLMFRGRQEAGADVPHERQALWKIARSARSSSAMVARSSSQPRRARNWAALCL